MTDINNKQVAGYLADLYEKFMQNCRDDGAWGQFIGDNVDNRQVGRYGTSAGAVIMGLAGHNAGTTTDGALANLIKWIQGDDEKDKNHYAQMLPKCVLLLGVSFLDRDDAKAVAGDLVGHILSVRLSGGLWGDYWHDEHNHDEVVSLFVSSVASVCLALNNTNNEHDDELDAIGKKIASRYLLDPGKHEPYVHVVIAAVSLCCKKKVISDFRRYVRRYSSEEIDFTKRHIYFYDYKKVDGTWSREYFIVPVDIFCIYAIGNVYMPSWYRLRGTNAIEKLKSNFIVNGGLFKSEAASRASTLEQAFAATALHVSDAGRVNGGGFLSSFKYSFSKPFYALLKRRVAGQHYVDKMYIVVYVALAMLLMLQANYNIKLPNDHDWALKACLFLIAALRNPVEIINIVIGRKK